MICRGCLGVRSSQSVWQQLQRTHHTTSYQDIIEYCEAVKYVFGVDIVILGDKHRCAEYQLLVPLSSSPVFEGCICVKYVEWWII